MTTYAKYPYAIGTEAVKLDPLAADPATDPAGSLVFTGDHFRGKRAAGWVDLDAQAGGGGPPTGTAGGDLAGTYPNPTIAAAAVGNAEISDLAYSKLTGAPTIPTTLPPSGTAGGDLSGTYPNPQLGAGVIVDADVSATAAIQYSKLTGTPTALPPSGAASGDLSGTYPAPQIAAGAIVDADVSASAAIQYTKLTGVPTALPPNGAASGDLAGTYPAPTLAKLNGAAVGTTTPLARGDLLVANATPALVRLARGTVNQVLQSNGTDVVWGAAPATGGPPTGTAGGSLAGSYPNPTLTTTGVTAAAYGDQYNVAKVTVNAEGRVTAVVQVLVRARWG